MKNTEIYIDEYEMKTTIKLNKIIDATRKHVRTNFWNRKKEITFGQFCGTKRMMDLRSRFEAEVERIGVDYEFGDCIC
jgi:hypothetical protein